MGASEFMRNLLLITVGRDNVHLFDNEEPVIKESKARGYLLTGEQEVSCRLVA